MSFFEMTHWMETVEAVENKPKKWLKVVLRATVDFH